MIGRDPNKERLFPLELDQRRFGSFNPSILKGKPMSLLMYDQEKEGPSDKSDGTFLYLLVCAAIIVILRAGPGNLHRAISGVSA
jgi:hypothetical protein